MRISHDKNNYSLQITQDTSFLRRVSSDAVKTEIDWRKSDFRAGVRDETDLERMTKESLQRTADMASKGLNESELKQITLEQYDFYSNGYLSGSIADLVSSLALKTAYAKDHLQKNFLGDDLENELNKLDEAYNEGLGRILRYADKQMEQLESNCYISPSDLTDLKLAISNIPSLVAQRTDEYTAYIKSNPDYAGLENIGIAGLENDMNFMVSALSKSFSTSPGAAQLNDSVYAAAEIDYMLKAINDISMISSGFGILASSEEHIGLIAGFVAAKADLYAENSGFSESFGSALSNIASNIIKNYIDSKGVKLEDDKPVSGQWSNDYAAYPPLDKELIHSIAERVRTAISASDNGEAINSLLNEIKSQYDSKANTESVRIQNGYSALRSGAISSLLESNYGNATKDAWRIFISEKKNNTQSPFSKNETINREVIKQTLNEFLQTHKLADNHVELMIDLLDEEYRLKQAYSAQPNLELSEDEKAVFASDLSPLEISMQLTRNKDLGPMRYRSAGTVKGDMYWEDFKADLHNILKRTNDVYIPALEVPATKKSEHESIIGLNIDLKI